MIDTNYPLWCEQKQRSYRCLSEWLEFSDPEFCFVYQRDYEPEPLPFAMRLWEQSIFEYFSRAKRQAWFEAQKGQNTWYCLRFLVDCRKYQWLGPFTKFEAAKTQRHALILEGACSELTLSKRHRPWTPFSDMIDGPEDYCSLSLSLSWESPPHPDLAQDINLLSDLLQPGPQFFGNSIHIEDPRALQRQNQLKAFIFHENFEI